VSDAGSSPTQHVLHVINDEFHPGAERVRDLLTLHLARLGYDVRFARQMIARGQWPTNAMGDSGWQRQRTNVSDESMAALVAAVYREGPAS
jgi:hypothetical protein